MIVMELLKDNPKWKMSVNQKTQELLLSIPMNDAIEIDRDEVVDVRIVIDTDKG